MNRIALRETVLDILRWLFLLWAILIFIYFLRTNWHLVFVFRGLVGPYSFSLGNTPPLELVQALVALGLTQIFGVLVLRALRVRLAWWEEHSLALPIGFGLSGVFIELLTMAHGLRVVPLWALWVVMIGGVWWAARLAQHAVGVCELGGGTWEQDNVSPAARQNEGIAARVFAAAALVVAGLITFGTFWHAVFLPESYWDSLILYLGYARMTFLEHAFPYKAEAQVGIGLGANYPHLFSTYGAMASTLFNHWSDLPQRLICPVAGLASTALVYATCLRTWGRHDVAAAAALLFRAVPYGIAYATWASDYAFAILFTAAFLHAFLLFLRTPDAGRLAVFTLVPAVAMHLNYLMGILWVPWLAAVLLVAWVRGPGRFTLRGVVTPLALRRVWAIYLIGITLAVPWYIRNWTLTGNPVYAFFPEIFTSSVRVNPAALRSAELEWFRVGDGVGKLAESYWSIHEGVERDIYSPDFQRRAGLRERLRASFTFWVGFDVVVAKQDGTLSYGNPFWRMWHLLKFSRETESDENLPDGVHVIRSPHAYKMMILFPAMFFPSLVLIASYLVRFARARDGGRITKAGIAAIAAFTSLLLLAYMYLLADFYLYQIIGVLAPAAVCAGFLLNFLLTSKCCARVIAPVVYVLVLAQGITPGLAFALMNFKLSTSGVVYGQHFSQGNLDAFRNPGMPQDLFYRIQYDADPDMWDYVNEHLKGERLLTHENRHYVLDPSITLVHLDDWEIQKGYGIEEPAAPVEFLRAQGLSWYLETEMEKKHTINRELGMEMLREAGMLREVFRAGDNVLYEIGGAGEAGQQ